MTFITENIILILVALTSGGMIAWGFIKNSVAGITPAEAVQLINRQRAVLIDVSTPAEFAAQHAKGAKNIPLDQLATKLPAAVKKKETPIVFICPHGKRSATATKAAQGMGFRQAQNLAGGLTAWRDAHMLTEQS